MAKTPAFPGRMVRSTHGWVVRWYPPGCAKCYVEWFTKNRMGLTDIWGPNGTRQVTSDDYWKRPIAWNKTAMASGVRMRVFCGSLCDVFEDNPVANATRPRLWALIRATPFIDWQLLTKRAERIVECLPPDWGDGYPNVWLGVSIENNKYVYRADILRAIPAVVHLISYEPALGPVPDLNLDNIQWLIFGGESGKDFRPMDVQWARDIKARCEAAGTAFFYKQTGASRSGQGITLDGKIVRNYPLSQPSLRNSQNSSAFDDGKNRDSSAKRRGPRNGKDGRSRRSPRPSHGE